ncbi:MAG: hypothetical protein Q8M22_00415 [Actinomycetota bacterium]|nr:hypothetical protein [Actinomycetota bacterium]
MSSHLLTGLLIGFAVGLGACSSDDAAESTTTATPTPAECEADDLASALAASDISADVVEGIDPPYAIDSDGHLIWYAASIDDLTGSAGSEKAGRLIYILSSDAQPDQVISLRYLDVAVDGSGSAVECGDFARSMTFDVTSASARRAYDLELAGSTTRLFPHTGDLIVVDA